MPSSDYTTAIPGGLKLKGAPKDSGVKKKKKSKSKTSTTTSNTEGAGKEATGKETGAGALQKALAEEEGVGEDGGKSANNGGTGVAAGAGKTEAQREAEERRRKRVRNPSHANQNLVKPLSFILLLWFPTSGGGGGFVFHFWLTGMLEQLDERLKREGVKTHKERVEELNKYLAGLSEHHDMPRIGPG